MTVRESAIMDMRVFRVNDKRLYNWARDGRQPRCAQCLSSLDAGQWCIVKPRIPMYVHVECMAACSVSGGFTAFEIDAVNAYVHRHDPGAVECSVPQGVLK